MILIKSVGKLVLEINNNVSYYTTSRLATLKTCGLLTSLIILEKLTV